MGKRIVSSIFGFPVVFLAAIFVWYIGQTLYELLIRGQDGIMYGLLIASAIGLVLLIIFGSLKKSTVRSILANSMGAR